jgi:hypothetical protein
MNWQFDDWLTDEDSKMTGRQTKHRQSGRQKWYKQWDGQQSIRTLTHLLTHSHTHTHTTFISCDRLAVTARSCHYVIMWRPLLAERSHHWPEYGSNKRSRVHPCSRRYCSLDSYPKKAILRSMLSFLNFLVKCEELLPILHPVSVCA